MKVSTFFHINCNVELILVVASSQGVPDALQKCHTISKSLQQNQTLITSQIVTIKLQLENFTKEVSTKFCLHSRCLIVITYKYLVLVIRHAHGIGEDPRKVKQCSRLLECTSTAQRSIQFDRKLGKSNKRHYNDCRFT